MSMLASTVREIVHRVGGDPPGPGLDAPLWTALEKAGMTLVSVPESAGGSDGDLADAATIVHEVGYQAAAVPVADTAILCGWLLARSGLRVPAGPMSAVLVQDERRPVPWAAVADHLVVLDAGPHRKPTVALVTRTQAELDPVVSLAGEPHARVSIGPTRDTAWAAVDEQTVTEALARAALSRAMLIGGAVARVLELSVRYCDERMQFGRPIGRFQAVQRLLAIIAAEAEATRAIVEVAVRRLEDGDHVAAWAAKYRASSAAGAVARAAHQIHGAIGMTEEHRLRHWTTRLWCWRDEFGSEADAARLLGDAIDGGSVWTFVTARL